MKHALLLFTLVLFAVQFAFCQQKADNLDTLTVAVGKVSFKMIKVNAGSFIMGALFDHEDAFDERVLHHVKIEKDYYLGQTEVTQELWIEVMGTNPSEFNDKIRKPVDNVNWIQCNKFITRLNELTGMNFRFPTEAEWEYAARGGDKSNGYVYSGGDTLNKVAWANFHWGTHEVMKKRPNELGLYDMTGNVWEFCSDWYDQNYDRKASVNPTGAERGIYRVSRGGAWFNDDNHCRITYRNFNQPNKRGNGLGLRLALSVEE